MYCKNSEAYKCLVQQHKFQYLNPIQYTYMYKANIFLLFREKAK